MAESTGRFRPADRLRHARDFRRVAQTGARVAGGGFVVLLAAGPGELGSPRLGITASRKVGGSVVRNRVKRRVREWFRGGRGELPGGSDVVVIARPGAGELSGHQIWATLSRLVAQVAS